MPKGVKGKVSGGGLGGAPWPRLGHGRGREGRRLPLRRLGRDLGAAVRGSQPAPARLVLQPHLRRPARPRHGLGAERGDLALGGRRQDLRARAGAARRQPRPVDRPGEPAAHDRRQRRRRHGQPERRRLLVHASTTSRPPSSTTSRWTTARPTACTARSRTTPPSACRAAVGRDAITAVEWYEIGGGESGYIAVDPRRPEHRSTPAATRAT